MYEQRSSAALAIPEALEIDQTKPPGSIEVESRTYGLAKPLTRADEIALARSIEDGNRSVADAIARSRVALAALAKLVQGTLEDAAPGLEPALVASDDRARAASELAARIRDVRAARRSTADDARDRFVESALEFGLSRVALEPVLAAVARARDASTGPRRRALEATFSRIASSRAASERAKATLVEANIGLVVWMARKRRHPGLSLHDLVQEGSIGLMRAVDKFDHRRGIRFNTYASWWVRHALNRALSDYSRTIRLPVHLFDAAQKVARISREFSQEHGREPSESELAALASVAPEKVREIAALPREPLSVEQPVGAEGDLRVADFLPADPDLGSPVDRISAEQIQKRLRQLLELLTPREARLLRLRFGFDGSERRTLKEAGDVFGISRERARQIEQGALAKLRTQAAEEELELHFAS